MMPTPGYSNGFPHTLRLRAMRLTAVCRPINLLFLMLIVESVVLLLSLTRLGYFFPTLALWTLYYQLVLFLSVGVVCHARKWLQRLAVFQSASLIIVLTASNALLVAWVLRHLLVTDDESFFYFICQSQITCFFLTLALLRYQYLLQQRYQQLTAQAGAQYAALQAYIRPHFLFNALNNLATVVQRDQAQAERLILAMAGVLRHVLRRPSTVGITEEIAVIDQYLLIERTRMGDRMKVDRLIELADRSDARFPAMILQPLLENAVAHGIARLIEGGTIEIRLSCEAKYIVVSIRNHAPISGKASTGEHHHAALDNVRLRLEMLYAGRASFRHSQSSPIDDHRLWWQVALKIPYTISPEMGFTELETDSEADAEEGADRSAPADVTDRQ